MLNEKEKELIKQIINESLKNAEKHWKEGGFILNEETIRMDNISLETHKSELSNIPNHPIVHDTETIIDEFIALVVDIRDSSKHLMQEISSSISKVTRLERLYYEISALLPAVEQTIKFSKGSVTEYLGDGLLALFKVDEDDKHITIREAYGVSKNIMSVTLPIVNDVLEDRYGLPPLEIGIGLSISKALVTLIGVPEHKKHPKAFGQCVFYATKLSKGKNEIFTDEWLKNSWPSSPNGKLSFKRKSLKGVDGYLIER